MNKKERITIQKVAKTAGVSKQTVSRVINNRPDVADVTRKRVQKVIDQLGYHPSAVARSLTNQRTHTIAVVTAGLDLVGPSSVLNGITLKAEELGYSLLLKNLAGFRVSDYQGLIRFLNEMRVEGVIWACPDIDHNRREAIEKLSNLPVPVVLQGSSPIENTLFVTVDNYAGGCQATQHLIDQGYRNIAHISGPLKFADAEARKSGWVDALEKAGMPPARSHWAEGDWSAASGARAIAKLMDTYPMMDAVFAANDQMAIGAMQKIYARGLKIPEDIAILGYDNIAESEFSSPPLTTFDQNFDLMGAKTIELLVNAINTQRSGRDISTLKPVWLTSNLIIRASSLRRVEVPSQ
jgi:DNA-binding LacI/PurR family transcriptional regulator